MLKSKKDFEKLVIDIGYKQLSPYIKAQEKVKLECDKGHLIEMRPNDIKSGTRCAKCSGVCPEQSREEFEKILKEINYKQLSPYIKNKQKVKLECDKGHLIEMTPNGIKSGKRCLKCSGSCPEQAREEFEKLVIDIGYKQLSPYIKNNQKVKLECDKGHLIEMRSNDIKSGKRCLKCSGKCPEQAREEFEKLITKIGYKQLSPYIKSNQKVKLECDKGHLLEISAKSIQSGVRCAKCSGKCPEQAREEFEKLITKIGYKQLSPYIKNKQKVKLECDKGHLFEIKPNSIKSGYRCSKCSGKCPEQSREEFKKILKEINYKQLSPYIKNNQKVKLECDKGHIINIVPNSIKQGVRCSKCSGNCPEQSREEFEKLVIDIGYKQLSPYIKNNQKVKLECDKGHLIEMTPDGIKSGNRCIKCAEYGYNHNKTGTIYLLKCIDNKYIKIGITNHLDKRLKDHQRYLPFEFKLIHSLSFWCGSAIAELEKDLLKKYSSHLANGIKQNNRRKNNSVETFNYSEWLLDSLISDIKIKPKQLAMF